MASSTFVRAYAPGEAIFRQGENGDEAFVVESGRVCIASDSGEEIAQLGTGEIFGEMALFSRAPRMAGATAVEPTQLRAISRSHIEERLEVTDPLLRHVLSSVMERLRAATDRAATPTPKARRDQHARQALRALQREHAIINGLDAGEFELHFQPILRLSDRQPVGHEALARWRHDGTLIPPGEFIPVTERSQLATRFGRWVAATACASLPRLAAASAADGYISINISTHQFGDATLLESMASQLDELGMPASALRLEITETQLLGDWEAAIAWLDTARALGMGVMLDDFGTGYSSLAYLHRLPLTALKIDRSFVGTMLVDGGSRKILRTITLLARDLGVDCIAEGIEEETQAEALAELGVLYGQGYHLGWPEPLQDAA